ncbi:EAL domain-containing protein [Thalassotalea sp. HSM 43]|uniref:putative bifunctional diguanylate cyclase/phosphodiesterase n=1 Tax=Thalassotalea sp. HSM 43 TaxID=2552945 RepID=UPI00107FF5D1|nr:EAL domain-containing protein [Thalassotalea sp. HSM 43]QBY04305.1 EAL domain-containing protein [Thalassotalea sp. HSM 43]
MLTGKGTSPAKLKQLLGRYKTTKKTQTGLLELAELCSTVTDMAVFYPQLQAIIRRYFPAKNLYIQQFTQGNQLQADHYYVDELNCSPIEQQLTPDVVEFITSIAKPVLINHDTVSIWEPDSSIVERPFPKRQKHTHLVDVWLAAPLLIDDVIIGIIGIKGFINQNKQTAVNLELIRFIARIIAAAIHRNKASELLKMYSKDVADIVFAKTQHLQKSNLSLRQQVEQKRKSELKLYYDAHHDALTKLPNRAMFTDRLEHAIKHIKRHPNHRFAVLFIDIDRFKVINDTLGHHVGDLLLIEIAKRILECIRGNDILSRLGGDEFVVLLDSLAHNDDAEDIAGRVIETIKAPFELEGNNLYTSASVGIAICDHKYQSATEVLRDADAAMYQAKSMGRGRLMFYDESMREELLCNLNLEQQLHKAIINDEFSLLYQPICELQSKKVIGYEALLRWQHPEHKQMTPDAFLQIAEDSGLIIDIEHRLMQQVAEQLEQWQAQQENLFVSINLSGKHLQHNKQTRALIKLIRDKLVEPENLIIEFNEKAFNEQAKQTLQNLKLLQQTGVRLALDNYGSGLSSLNYLNNYPFKLIKLDQQFVRSFVNNDKNLQLAKSLVSLGQSFGFNLVAEGLENKRQWQKAIDAGCQFGQGYYLGQPKLLNDKQDDDIDHCA